MKIDLSCPVELWQYAMPDGEHAECTFVMNNLSDKVVTSVQVTLTCYDREDELLFRQTERVQGLKAGVGDRFSMVVLPSQWEGVEGVDLVIEKVWFDDATVWRKGNVPLTHYLSNAMPAGRALDELRFVAGKDAVGYPQVQDEVWMCVCGRANALDSQRCCRCERRRDAVFASFSRENVQHVIAAHEQKLAETARKAREENNILQENQEKQRAAKRRRRKQLVRWCVTGLITAAIAVVAVVWGIPTIRYNTARDLMNDGHYDQAVAAFSSMGDYRDAQTQVLECDYRKAGSLLKTGGEEALLQARALFETLGEYSDSAAMARKAAYALGDAYLNAGSYEQAVSIFRELGDYEDSVEKQKLAIYRQAEATYDAGNYQAARVLFGALRGYEDADARAQACTYEIGAAHLDQGDYQLALNELETLGDYENAPELVKEAYYALAEADLAQEKYEDAGAKYQQAGDYADAADKANDCFYRLAHEKRKAGEYEKAMALFLRVPDYLDSANMAQACVYDQAMGLMENKEFASAAALLQSVTAYGDAVEKLDECQFLMAEEALEAGDAETAERLLAAIVDYRGSETQLRKVRYQLAEKDFDEGRFAEALERYTLLENYRDSVAKRKQCQYGMANDALEGGRYDEAIAGFEALGAYKQSKALLSEAQYQHAAKLKEAGDLAAAASVLSKIKDSKKAAELLEEVRLRQAGDLEVAGKYQEAADVYAQMPRNAEAQERLKVCRYELALRLRQTGDLPGAGAAFHELGAYKDAAQQSDECYAEYYGQVAQQARDAMEQHDYQGVITLLNRFEMSTLSKNYKDLPDLFNEACYQYADQLYRSGKPFDAIAYYQRVGDYRNAAEEKLERRVYLILGEWESQTGKTATFRMDGTCDLMGETLCYRVSNFSVYTGTDPESMTITHKLSAITKNGMSLRDVRDGQDVVYKFSRVGEFALPEMAIPAAEDVQPEPEEQPAPEASEDLLVTEETDEPKP